MASIVKHTDKRSGITYVYESVSYWDKETKMPRCRRKLIGRVDPETGEIRPAMKRKDKEIERLENRAVKAEKQKHHLPDPEEFVNDPDYYAAGETVKRQKTALKLGVEIIEYEAAVFRNKKTGSREHAEFPDGFYTDICYDSSVKASAFLLANEGNMSAGKIKTVLRETTGVHAAQPALSDGK